MIIQYLLNFKLFKCFADNPNKDDILMKFFQKIVYNTYTYSHILYQVD